MTDERYDLLFDTLEDALAKGFPTHGTRVEVADLGQIMDTSRALLMLWRGVEPIMPRSMPA